MSGRVVVSLLVFALGSAILPACKRDVLGGGDASADGSASASGDGAAGLDAALVIAEAGAGDGVDPPPKPAAFEGPPPGDMICFAAGTGKGATSTPTRPPPPTPRGAARTTPVPHVNHALKSEHPVAFTLLHKSPCIAGSCSTATGSCSATRRGFQITLNARFPSPATPPTRSCTTDCPAITAKCQSDALPPGSYSIELGGRKHPLLIPALSPPACVN